MRKVTVYFLLAVFALATSCGSSDRGELTGVRSKKKFFPEKPLGMTLIPGGAFTMGKTPNAKIVQLSIHQNTCHR